MAPVSLKIRERNDEFEVEIEEEETVEALSVVIYSLRPDLGEDFKILRAGKILKPDMVLSEASVKNGDLIFIAKTAASKAKSASDSLVPEGTTMSSAPETTKATFDPPPRIDGDEHPCVAYMNAPSSPKEHPSTSINEGDVASSPPSKCPRLEQEGSMDLDAPSSEQAVSRPSEIAQNEQFPAGSQETQETQPQPSTIATAPEANPEPESSAIGESLEPSATLTDEKTPDTCDKQTQPEGSPNPEPEVDASSAAGLMAFAASLENGGPAPSPAKLAELMRESASRMLILEGAIKEFGQALQMVNVISATSLRGGMGNLSSELGAESSPKSPSEEGGRSFLLKKGDADLQELHQKAASASPMIRTTSGTTGGGTLSSTPMSKEDMDKARQARLAKLEALQSEKQKEKDDADEKSRARDAMFSRRDDPRKPVLKH
jgi:hypothetical protein